MLKVTRLWYYTQFFWPLKHRCNLLTFIGNKFVWSDECILVYYFYEVNNYPNIMDSYLETVDHSSMNCIILEPPASHKKYDHHKCTTDPTDPYFLLIPKNKNKGQGATVMLIAM